MAELHLRPRLTPTGQFRLRCRLYEKVQVEGPQGFSVVEYQLLDRVPLAYKRTLLTKEQHQLSGQSEQHSIAEIGLKWPGYVIEPGWRLELVYRGVRPNELYHAQTVEDYDGRGRELRVRVSPVIPK